MVQYKTGSRSVSLVDKKEIIKTEGDIGIEASNILFKQQRFKIPRL